MYKEQKGITLVALVITIIVLLILAGVTIAALSGPNGILTNATTATEETAKSEAKEAVTMAINTILTNQYAGATEDNKMNASTIQTVIGKNYPDIKSLNVTASQATMTINGIAITVTIDSTTSTEVWKVTGVKVTGDN